MREERKGLFSRIAAVFRSADQIDDDFFDDLEEILIGGDIGIDTAEEVIEALRKQAELEHVTDVDGCKQILIDTLRHQMRPDHRAYDFLEKQAVVLVVGVNGVGKTTTIGKLAHLWKSEGKKVLLAAADTFRAAATEQLAMWADRAGVEMIAGQEGADPGSVIFDAASAAKARGIDVLICDTAGRLHNKKNLMDELGKLYRIIARTFPEAVLETLVVVDAATGQNALLQAKEFAEVANLTGVVLTKMDGTGKGGIALRIQKELELPVKYIGTGEKIEDIEPFSPEDFVDELLGEES